VVNTGSALDKRARGSHSTTRSLCFTSLLSCHITRPTQATQAVVSRVPRTTAPEFRAAVDAAAAAFPAWRATPLPARQRVMLRFQALIREHMDRLAALVTAEQGKTLADARGDVFRGLGA